ncbi:hypothetical protein NDN01_10175 [Sphingomonas sp. QA11]|uniref:hypothetical protein n=1 Tax=Sphingomonas sp. QA11 TaxID=2950605 RepID=UPI00234B80C6|nr:hypothetical protein [Sphingomonas sp. QA11]WCM29219.1 hypothetical protein NDN01_10175 [Sphingomonas sp. QA11]
MKARRHICDVPNCGATRQRWQRLCENCFARLPGEIRVGIAEAHHQKRNMDWRRLRKRAAEFLNLAGPGAGLPATCKHRVSLARVIELQQRILGERPDA